ncbi:ABC transporter permease [Photorhabdus tasmaniensis]|nr:ABC-2 family transporter protein [Photorhabdus tasmaniensis]
MMHSLSVIRMAFILSVKRSMQYRWDFMIDGLLSLTTAILQLLPLFVLFNERGSVAGWSFEQMLVLMGWYMMLTATVEGLIAPSLAAAVSGIRTGLFDYILMRPVDSLFLCSLVDIRLWKSIDFLFGLVLAIYAFIQLDVQLSLINITLTIILSIGGLATAYALFVLAIAASFALVRVQNLISVLTSLLGFARWPVHLFGMPWRLIFSFLIPIGIMTSYPVMALLGMLTLPLAMGALGTTTFFFIVARLVWKRALRGYRSASS